MFLAYFATSLLRSANHILLCLLLVRFYTRTFYLVLCCYCRAYLLLGPAADYPVSRRRQPSPLPSPRLKIESLTSLMPTQVKLRPPE